MTDATKKVIWKWESEAYGKNAPNTDPDNDGTHSRLDLRFPGQIADAETGFYYNMNRYYDPVVGRYTQSDPIGLEGGVNPYAYTNDNPLKFIDPLGLYGTSDFVRHYYDGGGQAIDLGGVGLLDAFQNSSSVSSAVSQFGNQLEAQAAQAAKSACGDCASGTKTTLFNASDKSITDVTNVPDLFAVGHSTFFRHGQCSVTVNCITHTFSYSCSENFSIRDKFADPLRARETFGKEVETGGTPYPINANFGGSVSGSGSF